MRRVMEEVQKTIRQFARGSGGRIMAVACEPEDSPLFLKSIDVVEADEAVPDVFLTFVHPFVSGEQFVKGILEAVSDQTIRLNQELTKQNRRPAPDAPEYSGTPQASLIRAMEHTRRIVPADAAVVWVMYPLEVSDGEGYRELMTAVCASLTAPELRRTRVIVRDSVHAPILLPQFERPGVQVYRPELDRASLERKFEAQANDPATPPDEQAQLHMLLAGFDVTSKRYDLALARNLELLRYFRHSGQRHQESVVLANIGDIYYVNGQYEDAQVWYERALALSVELEAQPMVMYQSVDAGNAVFMLQQYDDAITYYSAARELARASSSISYEVQALEMIGRTHMHAGRPEQAESAWQEALALSRKVKYAEGEQSCLDRLIVLYRETGNSEGLASCEREKAAVAAA